MKKWHTVHFQSKLTLYLPSWRLEIPYSSHLDQMSLNTSKFIKTIYSVPKNDNLTQEKNGQL